MVGQAVGECKVDLIVPGLVNGREMFGCLLNQGHNDEIHEVVRDTVIKDDGMNFLDKKDS